MVKRIWTPSWTLYSGGYCFLFLAGFYLLLDTAKCKAPFFPFMVIGANSITAYCIANTGLNSYITKNLKIHLGADFFKLFGENYEQLFLGAAVLAIDWAILYWMYRRKVFVRI